MKKKLNNFLLFATIATSVVFSGAFAQDNMENARPGLRNEEKFSERKAEMLSNLNQEKSTIDQVLNCVNSAQKGDDLEKCHEIKRASMEKMKEAHITKRKQRLERELKELNDQGQSAQGKALQKESGKPQKR